MSTALPRLDTTQRESPALATTTFLLAVSTCRMGKARLSATYIAQGATTAPGHAHMKAAPQELSPGSTRLLVLPLLCPHACIAQQLSPCRKSHEYIGLHLQVGSVGPASAAREAERTPTAADVARVQVHHRPQQQGMRKQSPRKPGSCRHAAPWVTCNHYHTVASWSLRRCAVAPVRQHASLSPHASSSSQRLTQRNQAWASG